MGPRGRGPGVRGQRTGGVDVGGEATGRITGRRPVRGVTGVGGPGSVPSADPRSGALPGDGVHVPLDGRACAPSAPARRVLTAMPAAPVDGRVRRVSGVPAARTRTASAGAGARIWGRVRAGASADRVRVSSVGVGTRVPGRIGVAASASAARGRAGVCGPSTGGRVRVPGRVGAAAGASTIRVSVGSAGGRARVAGRVHARAWITRVDAGLQAAIPMAAGRPALRGALLHAPATGARRSATARRIHSPRRIVRAGSSHGAWFGPPVALVEPRRLGDGRPWPAACRRLLPGAIRSARHVTSSARTHHGADRARRPVIRPRVSP